MLWSLRRLALSIALVAPFLAAGAARADDAPPPPPEPPPEPQPIDVSVHEEKREPEAVGLTKAETRLMPGAFGDPFRVIEALPGVVPLASGLPYFYVRGAPPGNVGYFLDGIRVPLLFHLGLGPAVIHPGLIGSVDLYPDGSTELGRFAGGIVAAQPSEARAEPHAEGTIRVIDAGAIVEVPFDHGKGDAVVAGRYSYTGPLFSLIRSDTSLAYGDYATRVSYAITPNHKLSLFAFGAYDHLGQKDTPTSKDFTTLVETMFHRIDLRYDQRTDGGIALRHDVILGWDQTGIGADRSAIDRMLEFKSALVNPVSDNVELRAGLDVTLDDVSIDLQEQPPQPADPECPPYQDCFSAFFHSRRDLVAGVYGEVNIHVGDRFSITPAARADVYTSGALTQAAFDPHVSTRTRVSNELVITSFAGLNTQQPSFIVSGPGFRPPLDDQGLQRALTASLGIEWMPDPTWLLKAAVYGTAFFNLNDALGTSTIASSSSFTDGLDRFDRRFMGHAEGLELSVKRRLTRQFGGFLAYSIGRSDRIGPQGEHVPSGFDRTHVASVALTYDFGKGFRGGLKNLFYTGAPILNHDPVTGRIINTGKRLDPFYRLDFRAEKRFTILEKGYLSIVLEMLNVFLARETIGVACTPAGGCQPQHLGPVVIPSIGIEGGF